MSPENILTVKNLNFIILIISLFRDIFKNIPMKVKERDLKKKNGSKCFVANFLFFSRFGMVDDGFSLSDITKDP